MGLPYSDFVLNIQPDDYQQLNSKIQYFLDNPARLRHMQVLLCSCSLLFAVCSFFVIQPQDLYCQEAAEAPGQIYGKVGKAYQTCCVLSEH